jgi:hypothetical protein
MTKFVLASVFAGIFSVSAFGASVGILGSSYEQRHQQMIAIAVAKHCGAFELVGVMDEREETIRIDQGIVDRRFTTILVLSNGAQSRTAVVTSYYGDHYDHAAKNWGSYSVEAIECESALTVR